MPYSMILWDFDGVIFDTFDSGIDALNRRAEKYKFNQITDRDAVRERGVRHLVLKTMRVMPHRLPGLVRELGDDVRREATEAGTFVEGIDTVIQNAQRTGVLQGIITSNDARYVNPVLQQHSIDAIRFVKGTKSIWRKERHINGAIEFYGDGRQHNEVLYIGDEIRDIKACKKAGIDVCAAAWGFNSIDALKGKNPTYLAETPQDLSAILAENLI